MERAGHGECVGPDTKRLWERLTVAAEMYREIAATARRGIESGFVTEQVLPEIERITGVPDGRPLPPPSNDRVEQGLFRKRERWHLTHRMSHAGLSRRR
jgi:hypothetical protein